MSWGTVHCSTPVEAAADPPMAHEVFDPVQEAMWGDPRPWTCNGPGCLVREFVTADGRRDQETVEECPVCDGHGGSHRDYRLITLEQQGVAS